LQKSKLKTQIILLAVTMMTESLLSFTLVSGKVGRNQCKQNLKPRLKNNKSWRRLSKNFLVCRTLRIVRTKLPHWIAARKEWLLVWMISKGLSLLKMCKLGTSSDHFLAKDLLDRLWDVFILILEVNLLLKLWKKSTWNREKFMFSFLKMSYRFLVAKVIQK